MVRIDIHRLRFLVIDDNAHMRRIVCTLLHGFGTREVLDATDGPAGFDAFNEFVPDIVLTERTIPIFDGLELTRKIRRSDSAANPFVPIIMISTFTDKDLASACEAGVTALLAKPISAKSLYQRIIHVIAHPRPFIKTTTYIGPDRRGKDSLNYTGPERRKGDTAGVTHQTPLLEKTKVLV